jgi:group I intron endonuclease
MKTNFYSYLLKRPNGVPFYAGKGKGQRCFVHLKPWYLKHDTNQLKVNIIEKIRKGGEEPIVEILKKDLTENEAFQIETQQIKLYGRIENGGLLANMSDGGEGQSGYHHTEELKKEFSERFSGDKNPFYGKSHSEKSLKKIGDTNRGKILNEEWRKKLSESSKGRKKSEEHKKKIQLAHQQRQKTPQEIQRLVDLNKSRKGIPIKDDVKIKISLSLSGIKKKPMSEETKNKIRQTRLERYGKH